MKIIKKRQIIYYCINIMISMCWYILIILFVIIFFIIKKRERIERFESGIPKIIHQTAPADKNKWHDVWFKCQLSWKEKFPDFEYKMWTDEDLDSLIKNDFSYFYEIYKNYDVNIKRIDIARYFILYKYGGIYADMDYICYKNFYDLLPQNKVSISESPFRQNEYLQNALMISPKESPFWTKVIEKATSRFNENYKNGDVLDSTGPRLISDTYEENKELVNPLSQELYNKPVETIVEGDNVIASHYCSATWL